MVNLSKLELERLKESKPKQKIYVTFNMGRNNLSPALKWRADQCNKLYSAMKYSGCNYNFVFEVTDFTPVGYVFPNVVTLVLVGFNQRGDLDTHLPYSFYVQLNDLNKYFKRYYKYNTDSQIKKSLTYYTDEAGVNFEVRCDYIHKVITVKNIKKLLIDNPKEQLISAKSYCHKEDAFDTEIGLNIALDKWKNKWRKWFFNLLDQEELEKSQSVTEDNTEEDTSTIIETETEKENVNEDKENDNMNTKPFIKLLNINEKFIGTQYGDFVVTRMHHRDSSKHVFWTLTCPNCGKEIVATRSNLNKGKVNTTCGCSSKTILTSVSDTDADSDNTNSCADFMSDSENMQKNYHADEVFVTGLCTEEDMKVAPSYTATFAEQRGDISFYEVNMDLFDVPVWFSIAHCIPADFTFHGYIAKKIDELWKVGEACNFYNDFLHWNVGEVVQVGNVYNLLATSRKYEKTNMDTLTKCVRELADICYNDDIIHLAMPRIGCGANGMNWDEVRKMIMDTFVDTFDKLNKVDERDKKIEIVVCNIPNKNNKK